MPNDIPSKQNQPEYLELMAAYHAAYERASVFTLMQLSANLILGAIASPLGDIPKYAHWGVLISVANLIADVVVLGPLIKRRRELGARLQELYDTRLLELPWSEEISGEKPSPELIAKYYRRYRSVHSEADGKRFVNWYPPACGQVPLDFARFICQRSNLYWDAELRHLYSRWYLLILAVLPSVGIAFALAMQWTLAKFMLSIVSPLLPLVRSLHQGYVNQHDAASLSVRTRRTLEARWKEALGGSVSPQVMLIHARQIQDEILTRRKLVSRIPDWFYRGHRPDFEPQMVEAAKVLVNQVAAGKPGSKQP